MNSLIRWNPVREMVAMQNAMDRMFDETWRTIQSNASNFIALDVYDSDASYTVVANVPGLSPDQINVTLHDGSLTISAEYAQPETDEKTNVVLQERTFGKFSRTITLPLAVDADAVETNYEHGVLTLTLPKSEAVQPRRIEVKARQLLRNNN